MNPKKENNIEVYGSCVLVLGLHPHDVRSAGIIHCCGD